MNAKRLYLTGDNDKTRVTDIVGGILVAIFIVFIVAYGGFLSLRNIPLNSESNGLQPLNELMRDVTHDEARISYREDIYTLIFDEDDIYEGWGKAAVQECMISNYFKEDMGQFVVEALWSNEAAISRADFIKNHTTRTWFKPYIDDKRYELKSVHTAGRFCVRFSTEVSDEDMEKITERLDKSTEAYLDPYDMKGSGI